MNNVAVIQDTDTAKKKSGSGLFLLFLVPTLFLLPPLWSLIALILFSRKGKQSVLLTLLLSGFFAFCLIYTTPIWDTIAHQYRYLHIMDMVSKEEFSWFSKDWFYRLEIVFKDIFGTETPFMYFWYLIYFVILLSWYLCAWKLAKESVNEVMLWIFATMGFLPILGYTRNALAFVIILLPGLFKKLTLPLAVLAFCVAFNLHDSVIMLAPAILLYLLFAQISFKNNLIIFLLLLCSFMFVFQLTDFFVISEDLITTSRITNYTQGRGRFLYDSDYIYVTLSLGWCVFMLYNAMKYKDKTNVYVFSIFVVSSVIYFAAFIMAQYTIRVRFQIIAISSGVFVTYPTLKTQFDKVQWQILKNAVIVSFVGYLLFTAKPILFAPAFQSPELCRKICLKVFYIPTFLLFDINTHGFADWIFKTTTWIVS